MRGRGDDVAKRYRGFSADSLIGESAEVSSLKAQGSRLKAQGSRLKAQGLRLKAQGLRLKA
jgi:hypothetical protein